MGRKPNLSVEMLLAAENKITRLMGSTVSIRKGNAKDFRKALGKWCDQLCLLPVCWRILAQPHPQLCRLLPDAGVECHAIGAQFVVLSSAIAGVVFVTKIVLNFQYPRMHILQGGQ